jgi:hypothetical protein
VNKSKPKLHCNGKCYLKIQLLKQDGKEQKTSTGAEETEISFFSKLQVYDFEKPVPFLEHAIFYLFSYYLNDILAVFHPPPFS